LLGATEVVPFAVVGLVCTVVFAFYNEIRNDGSWNDRDRCSPAAPAA
jgi:hypothetical protein